MSDETAGRDATPQEASALERDAETRNKVRAREDREKTPTQVERSMTDEERDAATENASLSALTVYSVIMREGIEELHRPKTSLWWSGVAAGIGISSSVLAESIIRADLGSDFPYLSMIESFGYTFGFVLVVLSRLQLFTENTITVVLPVLAEPTRGNFYCAIRLWAIVFVANMVGTFFTAAIGLFGGIVSPEVMEAALEISHHVAELSPMESLLRGIPAGFFIAALVWMLPSARGGGKLFLIIMFTWLIAAGEFTHVVAGSHEYFLLVLNGDLGFFAAFAQYIFPVLIGNIIGGTGLFTMLAYGQVSEEM